MEASQILLSRLTHLLKRAYESALRVLRSWPLLANFRFKGLGFMAQGPGARTYALGTCGLLVQDSGFVVSGLGCGVLGSWFREFRGSRMLVFS